MRRSVTTLLAVSLAAQVALAAEWYKGGTLHKSDLHEWRQANYANRLATSGDMVYGGVFKKTRPTISPRELRPYAEGLEKCISEVAVAPELDYLKIAEIAATCILLAGWAK